MKSDEVGACEEWAENPRGDFFTGPISPHGYLGNGCPAVADWQKEWDGPVGGLWCKGWRM